MVGLRVAAAGAGAGVSDIAAVAAGMSDQELVGLWHACRIDVIGHHEPLTAKSWGADEPTSASYMTKVLRLFLARLGGTEAASMS